MKDFLSRFSKTSYKDHLYALILAGGGGTRLWPRSRQKTPKQFLKLFDNQTLTQVAVNRFTEILPMERIFIVTVSEDYKREIIKEIPKFLKENIIVEPARRETGPAHALGALFIESKDPDAVIMTESADRLVKPVSRYLETLSTAAKVAYEKHVLIAMGVEPRYPHTGLGHIKKGTKLNLEKNVDFYKLEQFVEKPPLDLAKKYTASGKYLWNAGQYVWRADDLLNAYKVHKPEIYKNLQEIKPHLGKSDEAKFFVSEYKKMPSISVDYAISEKEKNFYVVAGDFFWTDIGDWREVWANSKKDSKSNVIISGDEPGGEVMVFDTTDSLIHSDGRMISVVGLDNIVIVDTKDALLVCSKSHAQSVKKIVEKLKEDKRTSLL
ncbi:MAG: sugar phosphate nucleotidyltransferase [Candidatus Microgenomates bacterium]